MVIAVLHRDVVCRQQFALVQSAGSTHMAHGRAGPAACQTSAGLLAACRQHAEDSRSLHLNLAGWTRQHAVPPTLHTSSPCRLSPACRVTKLHTCRAGIESIYTPIQIEIVDELVDVLVVLLG